MNNTNGIKIVALAAIMGLAVNNAQAFEVNVPTPAWGALGGFVVAGPIGGFAGAWLGDKMGRDGKQDQPPTPAYSSKDEEQDKRLAAMESSIQGIDKKMDSVIDLLKMNSAGGLNLK